jgi:lipoprotein-anchoring transpeptidase ErfK/SrfK
MRLARAAAVASLLLAGLVVPASAQAATPPSGPTTTSGALLTAPLAPPAPPPAAEPSVPSWWRPVPANSGTGRRIVYSMKVPQQVWVIDGAGRVLRQFKASGRTDTPRAGTYRVYSKSERSSNPEYGVTFRYMIRFTYGRAAAIGFHSIPRTYDGDLVHPLSQLGQPVGEGGCPHLAGPDARWLYSWAGIGTKVVVVR